MTSTEKKELFRYKCPNCRFDTKDYSDQKDRAVCPRCEEDMEEESRYFDEKGKLLLPENDALIAADLMEADFDLGQKYGYEYNLFIFELREDPELMESCCGNLIREVISEAKEKGIYERVYGEKKE